MAIADTKKCQHMIDIVAEEVLKIKVSATRLAAVRTAFQTLNPSTVGTALDGNTTPASNWIDSVQTAADAVVANGFLAARSGRHRPSVALGEGL